MRYGWLPCQGRVATGQADATTSHHGPSTNVPFDGAKIECGSILM